MSVLKDILEWSEKLPMWQRDVLRQLAAGQDVDIRKAATQCFVEGGGVVKDLPDFVPFAEEHIVEQEADKKTVKLKAIREVEGVGALRKNASFKFPSDGLNCIYGENGSGKSTMIRVLSQFCRCSAKPSPVLANVYKEAPPQQKAVIDYVVNGEERSFEWEDGVCAEDMQHASIFDSSSAQVYVTKENEITFTPFGLDILPKLGEICEGVSKLLAEGKAQQRVNKVVLPQQLKEAEAGAWYKNLSSKMSSDELKKHLNFTEEDQSKLEITAKSLAEADPAKRIKNINAKITRYNELKKRVEALSVALSEERQKKLALEVEACLSAEKAAGELSKKAFEDSLLSSTGGNEWKLLWNAAKQFAVKAYPDVKYPTKETEQVCLFCQQALGEAAIDRLLSFEEYMKGEMELKRREAQKKLELVAGQLNHLKILDASDEPFWEEVAEELKEDCQSFLKSAEARQKELLQLVTKKKHQESYSVLTESPVVLLEEAVTTLNEEIKLLIKAVDPAKKKLLELEYRNLKCREFLHGQQEGIRAELKVLKNRATLDAALKLVSTRVITQMSNKLVASYLTERACKAFEQRVEKLLNKRGMVALEKSKGSRGVVFFRLKLQGAVVRASIDQILSEGEFRAIALAAFLAEHDLSPHNEVMIFDDPVSSLDHKRRKVIASAIAEEAAVRQVLVFTHDIYFLATLLRIATDMRVDCAEFELRSSKSQLGYVASGSPMSSLPFEDRLKDLKRQLDEAEELLEQEHVRSYDHSMIGAGVYFRRLCEFTIERFLFDGVIARFKPSVHPDALKRRALLKVIEGDILLFLDVMERYSDFAHDKTIYDDVEPPDIDILRGDMEILKSWKDDFKKRRLPAVA